MATGKVDLATGFGSAFTSCPGEWRLEMAPFDKEGSVKN